VVFYAKREILSAYAQQLTADVNGITEVKVFYQLVHVSSVRVHLIARNGLRKIGQWKCGSGIPSIGLVSR
jgi:tetrahydromethanopterin S-methyltransferase subunit C